LGGFGANLVHFGSKIGIPEIALKKSIIWVFRIKRVFYRIERPK
jgi:hypothetical protein